MIGALNFYQMKGVSIKLKNLLHLKTGVSYLGNKTLLISEELIDNHFFKSYHQIKVPEGEAYAANCIRINDYVLMPAGYEETRKKLADQGFSVKSLDVSEFKKLDGGLSCLSLRF